MKKLLALALIAAPAPASPWFAPDRYSGLPFWAEAPGPMPQWFAWTANWGTINKWVTTMWPDPPRLGTPRSQLARIRLIPPKEYDYPFRGAGTMTIIKAASQDEVRERCAGAVFPRVGAFGCSQTLSWGCRIVVAPEADMKVVGLTMEITLRHEIAHCNGWPSNHRDALPVEDWAVEAMDTPTEPPPVAIGAAQPDDVARIAKAAGIGTDLSVEQLLEAYTLTPAFQTSTTQPATRNCGIGIGRPCD
jgi:hypothetical protein